MAPRALYQRLCQQLQACMPGLGVWPTRRLALIVTGLLLARHAALPRLAAQLRRVTPTAQADSIERRLRRILAHTEWDTTAIFEAFARASVRHLPRGRCVLLLDDTQQTDHCTLSTLALAYGGRALPLAWCRWSGKLEGQYWQQIDQLFEQATRILPPQVQPVLLADRGLTSPKLIKLARQRGWDYVLRVQSETTLRTAPRGHGWRVWTSWSRSLVRRMCSSKAGSLPSTPCGCTSRRSGAWATRSHGCWSAIWIWDVDCLSCMPGACRSRRCFAMRRAAASSGSSAACCAPIARSGCCSASCSRFGAAYYSVKPRSARARFRPTVGAHVPSACSGVAWTGWPHRPEPGSSGGPLLHQKLSGYEQGAQPPNP